MPLYEYQCETCAHRFEKIQKFSDQLEQVCPKCGGVLRKLLSSPAIQFKGSGWYITDYAKKDSGAEKDGKGEAEKSKGDGSAESKPAAKTETPAESKTGKAESGSPSKSETPSASNT